ncbi:response regulator [Nocardioides pocheonensis]|uniref:histidine kinase n=1 Tax=Nocardioides pocheonensis TaxID=661485 RepID=A0A3N0GY60_9ACTN|nr:response regulator [Nocardioides pocheonensis]
MAGAALAVFGVVDVGSEVATRAVADGSFVVFSTFAALACFRAARLAVVRRRLPWWLLGGAATCYAVGNAIWFYYQVLSPDTQTFPGPADVFFVLVVPFAVGAMLTLPSRPLSPAARARAVSDGLIVGAALLFLSWILVVGPLFGQLGEVSRTYLTVYSYYPLTDIVVISIASGLAVRATGRERLPMLLVAAGFVAIACADTGISYLALQGKDAAGSGLDLGWTFGYMLLGLAALTPAWNESVDDRVDPRALVREVLPYVPVGIILLVTAFEPGRLSDKVLVGILAAVLVLLVIRHMLTLADNIRLTGGLEDLVRERTHELEQLTHRHKSILDGAGDGIVGLDRSGQVTFANPAAAALLGRSGDELVGSSFHEITRPRGTDANLVPVDLDPIAAAMSEGQARVVADGTFHRSASADFPVELTISPVGGDRVTGAVVMFRDVTERRAVDRMKDEFVSVVSHELRTPLTSLRGALGLLQGGLLRDVEPKAQRMVHIAVDSTDRLIRLINDILDVERIAAGKLSLHREMLPAGDLLDRAVGEMRGLAAQNHVRVERGVADGTVDADADRLVQTVANLLSNAIKFSPSGGTVLVSAVERGNDVLFSVSDEGVGIPADHHEAVFGRFAQLDGSDTREQQGSGLGLAICRGIVEQHGGRIWVSGDSVPGTTICFTLPKGERAAVAPSYDDPSVATVLVCEDDADTRAVIGELLAAHGYRVVGAASGEEALALAAENPPDAVLMDLTLPGIDGWATVGALRSLDLTRHVPVLIVSGTDPGRAPVDVEAWLTKPLDLSGLLSAVGAAVADGAARPRVLVVEDDPALAQVLAALFAKHGVKAVHASTATGALRLSRDLAPDLLLLDLLLPDSDGFALVDWFREDPRLCRVPLVVYSALELDDAEKARLRLGPSEFFTKTRTNPEDVERQVMELLDTMIVGAVR